MTTFFTADQHFGHAKICELTGRPFTSVEEMNEVMIDKWNAVVKPGDTVWHLGDVAMGPIAQSLSLIGRLNGRKYLVPGNHDRCSPAYAGTSIKRAHWAKKYVEAGFQAITMGSDTRVMLPGNIPARMSHFPYEGDSGTEDRYLEFRPRRPVTGRTPWLLHGHVHEKWKVLGPQINVGVDVWNFAPVAAEEIVDIIAGTWTPSRWNRDSQANPLR